VRSYLVVVLTPSLAFSDRVIEAHEPVGDQAFRPELTVEAFDERIIRGLARPREVQRDAVFIGPTIQRLRDELRTIIDPDGARGTEDPCDPIHGLDHLLAPNALIDVNGQSFPSVGIDHSQRTQASAVEQGVRDKVHRPHLIGCERRRLPLPPRSADVPARPFEPQTQAIFPVQPVDPLVVHDPPFTTKQDVDPEIAVAHPGLRDVPGCA